MTTYYVLNNDYGPETSATKCATLQEALEVYREHMAYCNPILVRKLDVKLSTFDEMDKASADLSMDANTAA